MQTKEVPSKKALRWTLLGLAFSGGCLFFSDWLVKQPLQEPTTLFSKTLNEPLHPKNLTESGKTDFSEAPSEFFWTVPDLEKEIQVAYTPKKPGKKQGFWRLFFLRTQKSHPIKIHQNIPITYSDPEKGSSQLEIGSTDHVTLKPISLTKKEAIFVLDVDPLDFPVKNPEKLYREISLPVKKDLLPLESSLKELSWLQEIKNFKHLGLDLYVKKEQNISQSWLLSSQNQREKVELNDLFVWDRGAWKKTEGKEKNKPLAKIVSLTSGDISFRVWDESGENSFLVNLPYQQRKPISANRSKSIKNIRVKTPTKAQFLIDDTLLVMGQGEWAFKKGKSWQVLKTRIEEAIGNSELFHFVGMKKREGKKTFIGEFFNPFRSESQPFETEIVQNRQASPVKKYQKKHGANQKK